MEPDTEPDTEPLVIFPLEEMHHELGGRFAPYRGALAPADYGSPQDEYEALCQGVGWIDRSWTEQLIMTGADRQRFLGGLVSCPVQNLTPGEGSYGFVTQAKGRVMADVVVLAGNDELILELPPGKATEIAEHLRKYVIVDRVEISPGPPAVPLTLVGPRAEEVLAQRVQLPGAAQQYQHQLVDWDGVQVRWVRDRDATGPSWTLWVPVEEARAVAESLRSENGGPPVVPVGHRAYERLRVEHGAPLFGVDFDESCLPQETGLEDAAVSYTKGCYLGQEVIARIHYRGGVNRHLRGLVFDDEVDVATLPGREVLAGERSAGVVSSAVRSSGNRCLGLSILHRRASPGETVDVVEGGRAQVVELPFG